MKEFFDISGIPAALYGERSDKVFLFVHGQFGCKEEAERFAEVANPLGWQVLAIDLPEQLEFMKNWERETLSHN